MSEASAQVLPFGPHPPRISSARANLRSAIAEIERASEEYNAALQPAQRLGQVSQDLQAARAEHAAAKQTHELVLIEWLKAGQQNGQRPAATGTPPAPRGQDRHPRKRRERRPWRPARV